MNSEGSPRIELLVVEDNLHVIQQYKAGLRNTAFEATYVTDGEQALAFYRHWRPPNRM